MLLNYGGHIDRVPSNDEYGSYSCLLVVMSGESGPLYDPLLCPLFQYLLHELMVNTENIHVSQVENDTAEPVAMNFYILKSHSEPDDWSAVADSSFEDDESLFSIHSQTF